MPPAPAHGTAQPGQRIIGIGHRSMAACTFCHKIQIGNALLPDAHHGAGHRGSGIKAVHNIAAFIQNKGRRNAPLHKQIPNGRRRGPHDFFLSGQGKIEVMPGHKAFAQQLFRRLQHGTKLIFHVQRSPAPEHAVFQHPVKGRLFPGIGLSGHHIIVGQHHRRIPRLSARNVDQNSGSIHPLHRGDAPQIGVKLRQQLPELFKLPFVPQLRGGDRPAADHGL